MKITEEANNKIRDYRKEIDNIFVLSKPFVKSDQFSMAYQDFQCWEEEVALDLLIFCISELKSFSYELWRILEEFLWKYPSDGTYLRHEVCEKFMKKLKTAKIVFK